jgi:hypothetical protein
MLSIAPSNAAIASAAPVAADDVLAALRAGKSDYTLVSKGKSKARKDARDDKANNEKLMFEGMTPEQRQIKIHELAAAKANRKAVRDAADAARYKDIYERIWLGINRAMQLGIPLKDFKDRFHTPEEGEWYNAYERRQQKFGGKTFKEARAEAEPHCLLWRYGQSSEDRLHCRGYTWSGGYVAGKYWQDPFNFVGLKSDEHWLLWRFVTATAKASSGELRAGPTKDGCKPIYRRIIAHDEPYTFFGERCKDMFRIDVDAWFRSVRHLKRRLLALKRKGRLPFLPHFAVWIRDDKRPGIFNPHFYFLLPEDHAVWDNPDHHRLLNQVAAQLTEALGGDPGGLSNLFHGKSPLSPHCDYEIVNEDSFPTLSEYAKCMKLTKHGAAMMARKLSTGRLSAAGFDREKSNTYFNFGAETANTSRDELYLAGFQTDDYDAFMEATADLTREVIEAEIPNPTWRQREAIEKLIETCARWAVDHFDPKKIGKYVPKVGAAAHLMLPTDDAKTRKRKGQAYAARATAERNGAKISLAIYKALKAGGAEPTFAQIVEVTGFSLNTVKNHWFPAFTKAAANLSIQTLVKGDATLRQPIKPSMATLKTAETIEEIPVSWRNPDLNDHFRVKTLKHARLRRLRGKSTEPIRSRVITGKHWLDFIASGPVRVYGSRTSRIGRARRRNQMLEKLSIRTSAMLNGNGTRQAVQPVLRLSGGQQAAG